MRHLLTVDDLDDVDIDDVVRLGLLIHDRPGAVAGLLAGATVAVVISPPRPTSTKARVHAALGRLGATALDAEARGRGLPPPVDAVVEELRRADLRACVVAGPSMPSMRSLANQLDVPTFHAGHEPEDPWSVLAGHVAGRLAAANRERGAVDGFEEMLREAMVPTAAAVVALLAGCPVPTRSRPPIDLRSETASHWFG